MTAALQPQPTRDQQHRYHLSGHRFRASITGVLRWQKSPATLAAIEASRHQWEARGVSVHRALEVFATGGSILEQRQLMTGPFGDWVRPLLNHPLWGQVTVTGSERLTWCLERDIAGTFDLSYRTTDGRHILADLKTQAANRSPYDIRAQLGGYLALEAAHGRTYDGAQALWARPGQTTAGPIHSTAECLLAWAAAWARWCALGRPVAPAQPDAQPRPAVL